jgi:hypothetical protein
VRPVVLGLVIGLSAALAISRFLNGILFAISPTDPLTYAGVVAVLWPSTPLLCMCRPGERG